jgi:DNA modification methylase
MTVKIIVGDALEQLKLLPAQSVNCVVTSPPYWGLRDYEVEGQIGQEENFEDWLLVMVEVFNEVKRVLRNDGVAWVNLGDCYANDGKWGGATGGKHTRYLHGGETRIGREKRKTGLKPKDLVGMPWRFAFAARDAGWWLRRDVVWYKLNPLPENVKDRPTCTHEFLFMLTKSEQYFYDAAAIAEDCSPNTHSRGTGNSPKATRPGSGNRHNRSFQASTLGPVTKRNKRTVWTTVTDPYPEAHFATFPPALITPCILAGCPVGGIVLDPFGGSGTVGMVAAREGRNAILIELNPSYAAMARRRVDDDSPLFARAAE